jgi:hypothetical protein
VPVAKGGKKTTKPTPAPKSPVVAAPMTPVDAIDAFSVLDEADRKADQVELLRDRKTLEHAAHVRRTKEAKSNLLTNR